MRDLRLYCSLSDSSELEYAPVRVQLQKILNDAPLCSNNKIFATSPLSFGSKLKSFVSLSKKSIELINA